MISCSEPGDQHSSVAEQLRPREITADPLTGLQNKTNCSIFKQCSRSGDKNNSANPLFCSVAMADLHKEENKNIF